MRLYCRQGRALELTPKMQLRELDRADAGIAHGALGERGSAQRALSGGAIHRHQHAPDRAPHVAEISPIPGRCAKIWATARISNPAARTRAPGVPMRAKSPAATQPATSTESVRKRAGVRRRF